MRWGGRSSVAIKPGSVSRTGFYAGLAQNGKAAVLKRGDGSPSARKGTAGGPNHHAGSNPAPRARMLW